MSISRIACPIIGSSNRLYIFPEETQYDLLHCLQDSGVMPREVFQMFSEVRRAGNAANHALSGDHRAALSSLKLVRQMGLWFHRTFKDADYKSGPFIPPPSPQNESAELRIKMEYL